MATLSADIQLSHSKEFITPVLLPMRCSGAATFYRGSLVYYSSGQISKTAPSGGQFAGIVAENTVTTAANQFVPCYIFGLFLMANANITIANQGALLYGANGTAADNPADMTVTATSNPAIGRIIQAKTSGTDGWMLINTRD